MVADAVRASVALVVLAALVVLLLETSSSLAAPVVLVAGRAARALTSIRSSP